MATKLIEPFGGHGAVPHDVALWLERLRRETAVIDRIVATVAVPVIGAGAIVQALINVAGVETGDNIVGAVFQRQSPLYANAPWVTFDVWVYTAGQVYMTFYAPGAAGGLNATYEFFVLKAKQIGR